MASIKSLLSEDIDPNNTSQEIGKIGSELANSSEVGRDLDQTRNDSIARNAPEIRERHFTSVKEEDSYEQDDAEARLNSWSRPIPSSHPESRFNLELNQSREDEHPDNQSPDFHQQEYEPRQREEIKEEIDEEDGIEKEAYEPLESDKISEQILNEEEMDEDEGRFINLDYSNGGPKKFGKRKFPPVITARPSHNLPIFTGREKLRRNPHFLQLMNYKAQQHFKEQKFRGFKIESKFRPRKWKASSFKLNLLDGGNIRAGYYFPVEDKTHPPLQTLSSKTVGYSSASQYQVCTAMQLQTTNPPTQTTPNIPQFPYTQPTLNKTNRIQCPIPNCYKDFSDRSSLNRHRKNLHPESYFAPN